MGAIGLDRRKGSIGEVLGAVRLGLLPGPYIAENVAADALIKCIDAAHPFATALGHLVATDMGIGPFGMPFRARFCAGGTELRIRG